MPTRKDSNNQNLGDSELSRSGDLSSDRNRINQEDELDTQTVSGDVEEGDEDYDDEGELEEGDFDIDEEDVDDDVEEDEEKNV